ncbi:MAG: hypothetical protein U0791_25910 [Gemmataceae bacterium]
MTLHSEPLDALPLWLLMVLTCAGSGLALEAGYRYGLRRHNHTPEKKSPVGTIVGAVLALFAFLLAFTFSSAGSRYEARRQAVLDEANSIGTTYLRAQLLHEPQRAESLKLLREYIDVRVEGVRQDRIPETIRRSEALHVALWAQARKEAEAHPTPVTATYINALNQMIDIHSTRVQVGITNRVPTTIWLGLYALSFLGMASVGYQTGLSGTRRSPAMAILVVAFASVMFLIADLDRPGAGFITISQDALTSLRESMKSE